MSDDASEFRRGLRSLGRAAETMAGRVLGEKVIGRPVPSERVAISPEVDAGVLHAAEELARLLHAAGKGLEAHPLDPLRAVDVARAHADDALDRPEGLGPLSVGLRDLGGGLTRVAEGVLDEIAPRKPKGGDDASG
jgi:hypothetical protein